MHENNLDKPPPENLRGATRNQLLVVQSYTQSSKIEGRNILTQSVDVVYVTQRHTCPMPPFVMVAKERRRV